ncbi:component of SufBCD complex [Tabrizicola fusiformis]|uniref:component of SufBCD complex n=1 Tax=Tabrizicola sp. SY72 TaxID=2741673 RepID=UPI00322035A7
MAERGARALDWYKIVFELIDLRSFSNLWYWIMLGVVWSMASHWVLGVPFDMIQRARRDGGQAEQDLEALVRINTQRMLYISRQAGLWLVGMVCFLLSVLSILGFWYGIEFAQALLLLLFPLMLLFALSLRQARLIEAGAGSGEALYQRLRRHRFGTQLLGMVAIFVTSLFGMWQNMQIGFPH